MKPARYNVGQHPRDLRPARGRGFTLIELLTSMFIFIILLAVTATLFSGVQETIGLSTAQGEILTQVQTIEAQIRHDLMHRQSDSFIVIKAANYTYPATGEVYAADQLLIFTGGVNASVQTVSPSPNSQRTTPFDSARLYSADARVWWGQLASDRTGSPPAADPRVRALGRHSALMGVSPDQTSLFNSLASFWHANGDRFDPDLDFVAGQIDVLTGDPIELRRQIMTLPPANSGQPNPLLPRLRMADACFRIFGTTTVDSTAVKPSSDPAAVNWLTSAQQEVALTQSVIAPLCSYFRVEFAGDYMNRGQIDTDNNGEVVWYGLNTGDSRNGVSPSVRFTGNPNVDVEVGPDAYTAVFGYDQAGAPAPRMLRITIGLHDPKGRFRRAHERIPAAPDGRFFQFIVQVAG